MKKILIPFFLLYCFVAFAQENDFTGCMKKTSSRWGTSCSQCAQNENTYRVNLANSCSDTVEVKVAVQEKTKRWRIFHNRQLAPGDSISAYACMGTGKYLTWARKAGDLSVLLPSDEEIIEQYSK